MEKITYEGKVCKNGHTEKYKKSRMCVQCSKDRNKTSEYKSVQRNYKLKKAYGIDSTEYDRMFTEQGGECEICGLTQEGHLHVDHDHETLEVRGLLCSYCNTMLGQAKDNIRTLARAIDYLRGDNAY